MTDKDQNKDKYKDTVFLPATEFPMRGGLPQKEPEIIRQWADMDLYGKMRETAKGKKKWILHDGPPYANGNIHMGHAVNKILKDVVVKSYSMLGYDSPYVPGWDCHGLPIEWKIEEKYRDAGMDKDKVEPLKFREECRTFAKEWVDIQSEQFQRLGVVGDWDNPYLTMTNRAEGKIVREIHNFVKNGGLYKGAKPVMWSVVEKTALAEAEVEYKEHKSVTIWIRFPVVETNVDLLKDADVVIWTTTPWTMPSNRAIAFGEDIEYGVYEIKALGENAKSEVGAKIAVATSLADDVKVNAKVEEWELLGTFRGSDAAGTICKHPLSEQGYDFFQVPLLAADFVTEDAGTGFVHIAPGHGEDDFYLVQNYNSQRKGFSSEILEDGTEKILTDWDKPLIELTDNVSDDGKFRDHVPQFAGMEVYTQEGKLGDGNFAILKAMDEAGKLLGKGSLKHEYPHSWRSKAPLIFRTTPQWFISMSENDLRDKALKAIEDTRWVPAKGEARIRSMIANRPDWCISRQRAWGVPIALFVHKDTGDVLNDEQVLNRIGDIFEEEGSDSWWSRNPQDFLGNDYNAEDYDQVFDIVDVWFESGSTHSFVVEDTKTWPDFEGVDHIDLYLEGSDQHRGWFHSSLLESVGTRGRAPYKAVLTHGFVLDEKGYKMSKSLGNVVDPLKLMDQYGADIIRLWTLTCDFSDDIRIGKDTIKQTGDLYRRIRNTLRFLLGALEGFSKDEMVEDFFEDPTQAPELEQLVLHQLYEMDKKVRAAIEDYDFMRMTKALHDFCNEELSSFYFDIRKDRLYCDDPNSPERRMTRSTMAFIYNGLTAWLAPILAFTAEEAWKHRPEGVFEDAASVHLREFPSTPESWHNPALAEKWADVKKVRKTALEIIEPMRASKALGSSLSAHLKIYTSPHIHEVVKHYDFAEICIVSSAETVQNDEVPVDAHVVVTGEFETVSLEVFLAEGEKCQRCWKILPEVKDNGEICNRCADAVEQKKAA
ncbi:MAG: isoleucine--tRNA ligase [Alphaproteobacteria bacterium]|nr:isoleucine--tRNA ligase [Alphaproteobacteria bacterium]